MSAETPTEQALPTLSLDSLVHAPPVDPVVKRSIDHILLCASRPDVISAAGGLPAGETFPVARIEEIRAAQIDTYGRGILQYGAGRGHASILNALPEYLAGKGLQGVEPGKIVITPSSQHALSVLGRLLLKKGDRIAVAAPTYVGAVGAFEQQEPNYVRLSSDEQGIVVHGPNGLEEVLKSGVKVVYGVPTFDNPTGKTILASRRQEIAESLKRHCAVLIEDDPYGELSYDEGAAVPPIQAFAPDNVVYLGTSSKIVAPDFRIGWMVLPKWLNEAAGTLVTNDTLGTSKLNQTVIAEMIANGKLDPHLQFLRDFYRPRRDNMIDSFHAHMPPGTIWTEPNGGLFSWVKFPEGVDTLAMAQRAFEDHQVGILPGEGFYPPTTDGSERGGTRELRVNFSFLPPDEFDHAMQVTGELAREQLAA